MLSGGMDSPFLTPRLEYTEGALEDAAELLCEVTRDDTWSYYPTDCPQRSVAELTSRNDFSGLPCTVTRGNRSILCPTRTM